MARWLIQYTRDDNAHKFQLPITSEVYHDDCFTKQSVIDAWMRQHPGRKILSVTCPDAVGEAIE